MAAPLCLLLLAYCVTPTPAPSNSTDCLPADYGARCDGASDDTAGVTSIHAAHNALSLVLRKPDAMKFIKYVSAAAPGSRWDVAAEYACAPEEG